jgi:drug/metabolite transporter (DMT)-like permease
MHSSPDPQDSQQTRETDPAGSEGRGRPGGRDAERRANAVVYRTRVTVLLAVAGVMASFLAGDGGGGRWFLAASLVLLLAAAVTDIAAMVALKRAGSGRAGYVFMILILLGCLYFALISGVNLAMWQLTEGYRECVDTSLTLSSSSGCQDSLYDSIMSRLTGN